MVELGRTYHPPCIGKNIPKRSPDENIVVESEKRRGEGELVQLMLYIVLELYLFASKAVSAPSQRISSSTKRQNSVRVLWQSWTMSEK